MTAKNVFVFPTKDQELSPGELRAIAMKFVIVVRRKVRELYLQREQLIKSKKEVLRRITKLREASSPFNKDRISSLESEAEAFGDCIGYTNNLLLDAGRILIDAAPLVDAALTLKERCDVLNINVVDREGLTDEDGIVYLIHVHRLEDSAFFHGEEGWKFNGPLNAAMMLVYFDFIMNTAEGKKLSDSLFEPGGIFESVPMYRQLPNGSMERMPPRLRVVEEEQ